MNVVGFGGLEPNNATSCQLNICRMLQRLFDDIGEQGDEHLDPKDEDTCKTYFMGLFTLPPTGLYIRELNTWAVHIFFDGVDIHCGVGASSTCSKSEFQQWLGADLDLAWKLS
ncbi:hypothetical protein FB451DRAFT_1242597, partial [Mycena latifolia]